MHCTWHLKHGCRVGVGHSSARAAWSVVGGCKTASSACPARPTPAASIQRPADAGPWAGNCHGIRPAAVNWNPFGRSRVPWRPFRGPWTRELQGCALDTRTSSNTGLRLFTTRDHEFHWLHDITTRTFSLVSDFCGVQRLICLRSWVAAFFASSCSAYFLCSERIIFDCTPSLHV